MTRYNTFRDKYWYPVDYEITLIQENDYVNVKGLKLEDNGFSLLDWEGSGGYERTLNDDLPNAS